MILRVAIHPMNLVGGLLRDRLTMDGGFHLLRHARWFSFGSLGLEQRLRP
jgi:hypothetical protein